MAKHRTKQVPLKKMFMDGLTDVITKNEKEYLIEENSEWIEEPVPVGEFCESHLGEKLFPLQEKFANKMIGKNPMEWSTRFTEGHAFWGKGSGKDRTIAKLVIYVVYKLMCNRNPQKYLREKYGCSIGDDDAIDIGNMSINARQATNVFFKKFKSLLKRCKNPSTNANWFEERGVDLREGYNLQKNEVQFTNSITAHSLNSETHSGEGLNLFFVTIDEFGKFPFSQGIELLEAVRATVASRFKRVGSVAILSFKYYDNDPMDTIYKLHRNDRDVYSSRRATFEVNSFIEPKDLSRFYTKNPEKAKMTYECKGGAEVGGYVTKRYMLSKMFDPIFENPVKGNLLSVKSSYLSTLEFKKFFKGSRGRIYVFRCDLATGKKDIGRDCAGFSLQHAEKMYPKVDAKMKKDLAKEGIIVEMNNEEFKQLRKGVIVDLALQITSPNSNEEIDFSDIRNFVLRLRKEFGFNIVYGSYDGWESKDSIQILNKKGIDVENLSVDKNNEPYDTWKEMMYQQLVKTYPNEIAEREAKELRLDEKGKIDHPEKSYDRYETENVDTGSKDVMDCISGGTYQVYVKVPLEPDFYFA